MIVEMTAEELENSCPTFVAIGTKDIQKTKEILIQKYTKVLEDEQKENLRVYDAESPEEVVKYLYDNGVIVGMVLFYAILTVTSVILGDILMSVLDPRISFTAKAR